MKTLETQSGIDKLTLIVLDREMVNLMRDKKKKNPHSQSKFNSQSVTQFFITTFQFQ